MTQLSNRMANSVRLKGLGAGGDIDPKKVDVADSKPRAVRDRPDPKPELVRWAVDAKARLKDRPIPPGAVLEPAGIDREYLTAPHADQDLWDLQLAEAFGTRSYAVIDFFLAQLREVCSGNIWDAEAGQWRMNETEFNAVLALVNAHKPKTETQAMMAAHLVALHLLSMKVTARGIQHPHDERTVTNAAKLANATANLTATMHVLKGKRPTARQTIKVKKETHYHAHRHDHHTPAGGASRTDGQPHERNGGDRGEVIDHSPALPCTDAGRNVVPLPSDARQGSLRQARGKVAGGTEG
jgi:hypothetical protein